MKNLLTLFFLFITLISFSQTFKKGDKIQILWESKWYNGKIEEIKGDKYLVSYDGYDASWNETVGAERIKAGSVATTNTTSTSNTTSSTGTSFRSVETIWDLAKSPDGKYILATSAYGKIYILDAITLEEKSMFKLTEGSPIFTAVWSPDGKFIATNNEKGIGQIYKITEDLEFEFYCNLEGYSDIYKMRFSPKSNSLLVSAAPKEDYTNTQIDVWDIENKKIKYNVLKSTNANHSISDIEWSEEGDKIAVGISNKKKGIEVYDTTGKLSYRIEHKFDVTAVSFAKGGLLLATGGIDGKVTLWNLADKKQIWSKEWRVGAVEYINDIAFAPNTLTLAVCGRGSGAPVKIYNMVTGEVKQEFGTVNPVGNSILFSSDSKNVFVAFTTYGDISKVPVVMKYTIPEK
jgi:WD40 repeat protein